jgi:hypothetical protein
MNALYLSTLIVHTGKEVHRRCGGDSVDNENCEINHAYCIVHILYILSYRASSVYRYNRKSPENHPLVKKCTAGAEVTVLTMRTVKSIVPTHSLYTCIIIPERPSSVYRYSRKSPENRKPKPMPSECDRTYNAMP